MKKTLWVFVLAVTLVLFCMMSAAGAEELACDQSVVWTVNGYDDQIVYTFTPETDALYEIRITPESEDTSLDYLTSYVPEWWVISRTDGDDTGRKYTFYREAGSTITLQLDYYNDNNDAAAYGISVSQSDSVILTTDSDEYPDYGDTITLTAWAYANHPVSYQWGTLDESGVKTPMEGKTGNRCTIDRVEKTRRYYCDASAGYDTQTVFVYVTVSNGLTLYQRETDLDLRPEDAIDLTVFGHCNNGDITYQWYRDGEIIEGATESSYHRPASETGRQYVCTARDDYGNSESLTFSIRVLNRLTVSVDPSSPGYIMPDGSARAAVAVSALDTDGLGYQWYRRSWNDETWDYDDTPIENATEQHYTLNSLTEDELPAYLLCVVTDRFGNTDSADFEIWETYDLSVDIRSDPYGDTVYPGEHYTLTAEPSYEGLQLSYEWYRKTGTGGYALLEGQNGPTCAMTGTDRETQYKCRITDTVSGVSAENVYTVYVDDDPGIRADGGTDYVIAPGQEMTLSLISHGLDVDRYEWIKWSAEDGSETPVGGNAPSVTVCESTQGSFRYGCTAYYEVQYDDDEISEEYEYIEFTICVDNGFSAAGDMISYPDRTGAALRVDASCHTGTLSYQWYRYSDDNGYEAIQDATGTQYNADNLFDSTWFSCEVTDDYGNEEMIEFWVESWSVLQCVNRSPDTVSVPYHDPVTLFVEYDHNTELTYRWYQREQGSDDDWELIENAEEAAFTALDMTDNTEFLCVAGDRFEHEQEQHFCVYVSFEFEPGELSNEITIVPCEEVTMAPSVIKCSDDSLLRYRWYRRIAYEETLPETGASLTVNDITENCEYLCYVAFRDEEYCYSYRITVDNQLSAEAAGDTEITLHPDQTATLAITAGCRTGDPVYRWWQDNYQLYDEISSTLTVPANGDGCRYYCYVSDPFDPNEERVITFSVSYTTDPAPELITRTLSIGETVSTDMEQKYGNATWYRITPEETGFYMIHSESGNNIDPVGILYNDRMTSAGYDDDAHENLDFEIHVALAAGKTYYLKACNYSGSADNYQLTIDREDGFAAVIAGDDEIEVAYGTKATLAVITSENYEGTSFQWGVRTGNWTEEITGATCPSYMTDEITAKTVYFCCVTNGRNREVFSFTVQPVSTLQITPDSQQSLEMTNTETLTLTVNAESDAGGITYQWFEKKYDPVLDYYSAVDVTIAGATESTYAVSNPEERYLYYYCLVQDAAGHTDTAHFHVTVNSELALEAEGNTGIDIHAGDSVTMKVSAVSAGPDVTYTWTARGDFLGEGPEFTAENITTDTRFTCTAEDALGGEAKIVFEVRVDPYFIVDTGDDVIEITPGEDLQLSVEAYSDTALSYTWYTAEAKDPESASVIPGEAINRIRVTDVQSNVFYCCRVQDAAANRKDVWFEIRIISNLSASATQSYFRPNDNELVTMRVTASSSYGLYYQWYGPVTEQRLLDNAAGIEEEQNSSYTPEAYTAPWMWYRCVVSDRYGNTDYVDFEIEVISTLSAEPDGDSEPEVPAGKEMTMAVNAAGYGQLSYRWFEYRNDEYGMKVQRILDWADSECTLVPVMDAVYICSVTDLFGTEVLVRFSPRVINELTVTTIGETTLSIDAGTEFTLEVEAECTDGEISYQWYESRRDGFDHDGDRLIPGADQTTLTVDHAAWYYQSYYCQVQDEYGQTAASDRFYVYIDNHLTAEPADDEIEIALGSTATLEVSADYTVGPVTYQWIEAGYYDQEAVWHATDEWIAGANEQTYTTGPISESVDYCCLISDTFGNSVTVRFSIRVIEWSEPEYAWSDDNRTVTATRIYGDHISEETETVDTTFSITVHPTETADGFVVYTSGDFQNEAFARQEKTVRIPSLSSMNTLYLPSQIEIIEEEAFMGAACEAVIIPDGCTTIESRAFANCENLQYVQIPASVTFLPQDVFDECGNVIIDDLRTTNDPVSPR